MWKQSDINLVDLNNLSRNTMGEVLQIFFTDIGSEYLTATMPVNTSTHQPYGLLHGGASAALAETVGSVASWLCIDPNTHAAVGMHIECSHLRSKKQGIVTATATPLHIGKTTHVWDIKIKDELNRLIAVSKLTVAVIKKPQVI